MKDKILFQLIANILLYLVIAFIAWDIVWVIDMAKWAALYRAMFIGGLIAIQLLIAMFRDEIIDEFRTL